MKPATLIAIALVGLHAVPARADGAAPHALVVHVAPTATEPGQPIELEAMIDAPYAENLSVRWRSIGTPEWHDVEFERSSAGGWYVSLPPAESPGIEYYIRGKDGAGAEVEHFASAAAPHVVHVDPSLFDRLEALDRRRLAERMNEVSFDVAGHDFGNRWRIPDRFLRSELVYTHRFLRILHEVGFGFGSISGETPVMSEPGGAIVRHGLRYGFGQLRMRLHPSVFVDARVNLGVSYAGFEQGVRGAVTFGKPWRSSVTVGGEWLGDLGPSAWVRLQWDTAPPLLMGASIVRTDLPGALIARAGLYVAYDVAYRIVDRVTLRAQLSYGSRDGAAHFGGGLGTAVDF
jgi:hypothetical protein